MTTTPNPYSDRCMALVDTLRDSDIEPEYALTDKGNAVEVALILRDGLGINAEWVTQWGMVPRETTSPPV